MVVGWYLVGTVDTWMCLLASVRDKSNKSYRATQQLGDPAAVMVIQLSLHSETQVWMDLRHRDAEMLEVPLHLGVSGQPGTRVWTSIAAGGASWAEGDAAVAVVLREREGLPPIEGRGFRDHGDLDGLRGLREGLDNLEAEVGNGCDGDTAAAAAAASS